MKNYKKEFDRGHDYRMLPRSRITNSLSKDRLTDHVPYQSNKKKAPKKTVDTGRAGLCMTCNNASSCVYRSRRGYDALYCELYDGYADATVKGNGHGDEDAVLASARAEAETTSSGEYRGLCQNCIHRDTCKLAKPEGGIWHCEEYE